MDEYRGQKVLVTGGLGFIGSNLAIRLAREGAHVTIIDSLDPSCGGNPFNIEPVRGDVQIVEGDVRDIELTRRVVAGKSFVFSLAGHVSHIQSMQDPMLDLQLNAVAPLTVLMACREKAPEARVVYAGTRQAYGRPQSLPLRESHVLRPVDINGVNKMAGEWYHVVYAQAYGMPCTSLRMVNTYGPRQLMRHSRQGFAGWFIRKAIEGEEIQIFGDGQQFRGLNFVDDVVDALLLAGLSPAVIGEVFNLGGAQPLTLEAFAATLVRCAGSGSYRIVPFPEANKAIDMGSVYTDSSRFQETTGWRPKTDLDSGLRQTIAYYREFCSRYW